MILFTWVDYLENGEWHFRVMKLGRITCGNDNVPVDNKS